METSILLGGQMRWRGGLRCALEECGGQCVMMVGIPMMPEWYADSWDMKWMCQGHVSFNVSLLCFARYFFHSCNWSEFKVLFLRSAFGSSSIFETHCYNCPYMDVLHMCMRKLNISKCGSMP